MSLLLCLACVICAADLPTEPETLLERARKVEQEIGNAKAEGRDARPLSRELLQICTQLRRAEPRSFGLCMNEGNAATLAGDWTHALLAYRLAQRLRPAEAVVEMRLAAVATRLQVPVRQPTPNDEFAASLATQPRLRMAFWTLALLLYALAWLRLGGILSGQMPSGVLGPAVAILGAVGLISSIYWADGYRARMLEQSIAIIRRGEPAYLREGNGLSYPTVIEDRLRPGTEVRVLGKRGDWLHVRTASGLTGWTPLAAAEVE